MRQISFIRSNAFFKLLSRNIRIHLVFSLHSEKHIVWSISFTYARVLHCSVEMFIFLLYIQSGESYKFWQDEKDTARMKSDWCMKKARILREIFYDEEKETEVESEIRDMFNKMKMEKKNKVASSFSQLKCIKSNTKRNYSIQFLRGLFIQHYVSTLYVTQLFTSGSFFLCETKQDRIDNNVTLYCFNMISMTIFSCSTRFQLRLMINSIWILWKKVVLAKIISKNVAKWSRKEGVWKSKRERERERDREEDWVSCRNKLTDCHIFDVLHCNFHGFYLHLITGNLRTLQLSA